MDRYKNLNSIDYKGHIAYGKARKYAFTSIPITDSRIKNYKVKAGQEGRPDLIANAVYGDSKLFWVLLEYNNVVDVFGWPKIGSIIRYPTESAVLPELI